MIELQINACKASIIDALIDLLEEAGALSITLMDEHDNPILEPGPGETPLWQDMIIKALFEDADLAHVLLLTHYPELTVLTHTIPQKDWERVCMTDFKPQRFGERLWICPTWHTPPEPNHVNLMLDPGLAFGTGAHQTTGLCLAWLEQASLENKTLLDFGCGSGILALAALKLGAKHVYAVDIDEQALIATQSNAEINEISQARLSISQPDNLHVKTDYILANILLTPLLALKKTFHASLHPEGLLVVSGLLATQTEMLMQTYEGYFTHEATHIKDEWALMIFKRIMH
ncbi:MAG: 50S ribosomal protein L11 methyltransferase [Legionellaceae bacterium]